MIKIGALWKAKHKNGKTMFSGQLGNDARILILENNFKKEDKHPDFNIFIVEKKKKDEASASEIADMAQPVANTIDDDDIPF